MNHIEIGQKVGLVIVLLLIVPQNLVTSSLQGEEVVLDLVNVHLPSEESFVREIILEPFALHRIVSSISEHDSAINEPIVTVSIETEQGSGRTSLHRGDRPIANSTWTPTGEQYTVTVYNSGLLGDITFNLTITQLGPAESHFPEMTQSLMIEVALLILLTILPLPLLYGVLAIYRKKVLKGDR